MLHNNTNKQEHPFDVEALMSPIEKNVSEKITPITPDARGAGKIGTESDTYLTILSDMVIIDDNEGTHTAESLHRLMGEGDKYDIHCPFPGHEDKNPSAFVNMQANKKMFICCLSCVRKGFYPSNTPSKSVNGIIIPSIDKEAIIAEMLTGSKPMKAIIADIINALPTIERG